MSLINQMLKDLDERAQKKEANPPSHLYVTALPVSSELSHRKLIVFGSIFICAAMALVWTTVGQRTVMSSPALAKPTTKNMLPVPPQNLPHQAVLRHYFPQAETSIAPLATQGPLPMPENLPPPAALIENMTAIGTPAHTELQVNLNTSTLYHINENAKQNALTLTLENTYLPKSFSPVSTMDTAIKNIDVVNAPNNQVKIHLQLLPSTQVSHLSLTQAHKLILELSQNENAPSPISTHEKGSFVKHSNTSGIADEMYSDAVSLIQEQHYDEAIRKLQVIVAQIPEFEIARENLAILLMQESRPEDAKRLLENGLHLDPNAVSFTKLLARIYATQGDTSQALALLEKKAPALQEDPEYYSEMAALYQEKNPLQAAQLYEALLALHPDSAFLWMGMGTSLEKAGKINSAIEAYQKAAQLGNLSPELRSYVDSKLQTLGGVN